MGLDRIRRHRLDVGEPFQPVEEGTGAELVRVRVWPAEAVQADRVDMVGRGGGVVFGWLGEDALVIMGERHGELKHPERAVLEGWLEQLLKAIGGQGGLASKHLETLQLKSGFGFIRGIVIAREDVW